MHHIMPTVNQLFSTAYTEAAPCFGPSCNLVYAAGKADSPFSEAAGADNMGSPSAKRLRREIAVHADPLKHAGPSGWVLLRPQGTPRRVPMDPQSPSGWVLLTCVQAGSRCSNA